MIGDNPASDIKGKKLPILFVNLIRHLKYEFIN